jgi:hypothetical protein
MHSVLYNAKMGRNISTNESVGKVKTHKKGGEIEQIRPPICQVKGFFYRLNVRRTRLSYRPTMYVVDMAGCGWWWMLYLQFGTDNIRKQDVCVTMF